MIERLLTAEAALKNGELEVAGRLFAQVAEADGRNAIAVVGLARIAEREGRTADAQALVERALAIDPDEAAALRLIRELAVRTLAAATVADGDPAQPPIQAAPDTRLPTTPPPARIEERSVAPPPTPSPAASPSRRPSLVQRIRAWLARLGGRT